MLAFVFFFLLEKTKLPCQLVGKKIMFYGGSSTSVVIHFSTEKDVIKVNNNNFLKKDEFQSLNLSHKKERKKS